jgi:hypothetical protein
MLETSRRGFFGLLAGALLAKVIGPRLIAGVDRAPAMREAAASHIVEHTYLPLEVFSSRVLEIVNQELKWLRLKQVHSDFEHLHLGDTVAVREPCRFEPREGFALYGGIVGRRMVNIDCHSHADLTLDADFWRFKRPWKELDELLITPLGMALAENVIRTVRRRGGGEYLVCVDQAIPGEVKRGVISKDPGVGLSLRALEDGHPSRGEPRTPERVMRFDIMFGLG